MRGSCGRRRRRLIKAGAAYGVLAHNHPSGRALPSDADVEYSARIWETGLLIGIEILDSLVVTRRKVTSLAELGLLPSRMVPAGCVGLAAPRPSLFTHPTHPASAGRRPYPDLP